MSDKQSITNPIKERFENFISMEPNTGCWLWTGTSLPTGYGEMTIKRKTTSTHRISYELFIGEIPDKLWVLHHCDTPACVNPKHLYLGTRRDNTNDMVKRGRWNPASGCKGMKFSEEWKRNISKAKKNISEDTRKKYSEAAKGKKHTYESKIKISEANKGNKNPRYGIIMSDETKRKISEALKGRKHIKLSSA